MLKDSEVWQRYLDSLDYEPPRPPYSKGKIDKVRESIRIHIQQLKLKEDEMSVLQEGGEVVRK